MICKINTNDFSYSLEGISDIKHFNSRVLYEEKEYLVYIDGLFTYMGNGQHFNKTHQFICQQILDYPISELSELLDGVFRVVVLDKKTKKARCFTSLDGQLPLFVYQKNHNLIISSNIKEISNYLETQSSKLTLSRDGAYMLLGHGFMLESHTLFEEIRRVLSHKCWSFSGEKITVEQRFKFDYEEYPDDENNLLEEFNRLFVKAIKKQFTFDKLSNKKHLVALSGGLDSRMVSWVAHELGYTNQLNYTFAQTGSGDELIPKQIASFLNHDWLFNSLDNGNYLLDYEKSISLTEGNSVFAGMAHSLKLYGYLNFSKFGVVHSGQLGDVILSWPRSSFKEPKLEDGAYNNRFVKKIDSSLIDISAYQNDMDFKYLNRYINGTNYGLRSVTHSTCSFSPFLDEGVWTFLTRVPLRYKINHKFYVKWMKAYYPKSTDFVYDAWNLKPGTSNSFIEGKIKFQGRAERFSEILSKGSRAFSRKLGIPYKPSTKAMNPYEAWWETNSNLSKTFNELFDKNVVLLDKYPQIKKDALNLFKIGKVSEKLQVMDLLLSLDYIKNFK